MRYKVVWCCLCKNARELQVLPCWRHILEATLVTHTPAQRLADRGEAGRAVYERHLVRPPLLFFLCNARKCSLSDIVVGCLVERKDGSEELSVPYPR